MQNLQTQRAKCTSLSCYCGKTCPLPFGHAVLTTLILLPRPWASLLFPPATSPLRPPQTLRRLFPLCATLANPPHNFSSQSISADSSPPRCVSRIPSAHVLGSCLPGKEEGSVHALFDDVCCVCPYSAHFAPGLRLQAQPRLLSRARIHGADEQGESDHPLVLLTSLRPALSVAVPAQSPLGPLFLLPHPSLPLIFWSLSWPHYVTTWS